MTLLSYPQSVADPEICPGWGGEVGDDSQNLRRGAPAFLTSFNEGSGGWPPELPGSATDNRR